MSNRTSEANKAITLAWENEQKLISEGKGTRDWTPEQQNDILQRGKAYDEEGKAFRGHHMRSVSISPDDQGNPDNIQFLSHAEHIEAHIICWQPTNWYYDPVTKQRVDFGDGPIIPCKIIELSEPFVKIEITSKSQLENEIEPVQPEEKIITGTDSPNLKIAVPNNQSANNIPPKNKIKKSVLKDSPGFFKKICSVLAETTKARIAAIKENPEILIDTIEEWAELAAYFHGVRSGDRNSNNNRNMSYTPSFEDPFFDEDDAYDSCCTSDKDTSMDRVYPKTHASPKEHIVSQHGQHYNTKEGRVWIEKESFHRGGKSKDIE